MSKKSGYHYRPPDIQKMIKSYKQLYVHEYNIQQQIKYTNFLRYMNYQTH